MYLVSITLKYSLHGKCESGCLLTIQTYQVIGASLLCWAVPYHHRGEPELSGWGSHSVWRGNRRYGCLDQDQRGICGQGFHPIPGHQVREAERPMPYSNGTEQERIFNKPALNQARMQWEVMCISFQLAPHFICSLLWLYAMVLSIVEFDF